MRASKVKKQYICQQCGKESPKWLGRCTSCNQWNTFIEVEIRPNSTSNRAGRSDEPPGELADYQTTEPFRLHSTFQEMNRVLGGGLVQGSLVLIAGDPGIGKSTLLLQICAGFAADERKILYVTGEESVQQLKLRSERLSIKGKGLYILAETDLHSIFDHLDSLKPDVVVIDSIQTMFLSDLDGIPGSLSQVRECTLKLMSWSKNSAIPVFITGHVTKDGAIAGPRVLEHIVDCVLYLSGENYSDYRILRSSKNRFGSTNEVGIFEMLNSGLVEVLNPSEVFIRSNHETTIGSTIVSTLEGSRPLLLEVQALTNFSFAGQPRRITNGIDFGRLLLISAVLTRRAGLNLSNQDIIVNVTGGMRISEPAADLGIGLAIASSFKDKMPLSGLVAIGEIGLSGEIRPVSQMDRRIMEAERMGFRTCVISERASVSESKSIKVIKVGTISEAVKAVLGMKEVSR